MAENTKIEWADHTFNPWIGCTKVSPACDHCYAEADFAKRRKVVQWGAGQPRKHTAPSTWEQPLRWNAEAERLGVRYRVFCASLADVFDNEVPAEWRVDLFRLITSTPHLDWLLLTKRIGNVVPMSEAAMLSALLRCSGEALALPSNVWIGASITSQAEADRDIPKLLAVPAAKRFLSMEPLLGPVELNGHEYSLAQGLWEGRDWLTGHTSQHSSMFGGDTTPWLSRDIYDFPQDAMEPRIHWVIVGGESGPGARPMHPDWVRSLRDQCQAAGVPFFMKQWGEWADMQSAQIASSGPVTGHKGVVINWMRQRVTFSDGANREVEAHSWTGHATNLVYRVGKKAAGRLLDGREWNEVPA